MRSPTPHMLPAALMIVLALAAAPSWAGTIVINPISRTIDTSRLRVHFDQVVPDMILQILFKDLSPTQNLTAYYGDDSEFWGQLLSNTSSPGFIQGPTLETGTWTVANQSTGVADIVTTSQSSGLPLITTRYRFFADQPYFTVDRTIGFAAHPDTSAYQPYVPRALFFTVYHATRWRDTQGVVQQRGFCAIPCLESGWNRHWVELMAYVGHNGLSMTSFFPASMPANMQLVDGYGPNTQTGWIAPIVPAGAHTQDVTQSQMIGFSLTPDNYAALDSMWTVYTSGSYLADVPASSGVTSLRLELAPNPSRAATTIAWTSPADGAYALDVLDLAGRRVARLQAGWAAAGRRTARWDGRDDRGALAAPGLYFVRLAAPGGTRVARLVRSS